MKFSEICEFHPQHCRHLHKAAHEIQVIEFALPNFVTFEPCALCVCVKIPCVQTGVGEIHLRLMILRR